MEQQTFTEAEALEYTGYPRSTFRRLNLAARDEMRTTADKKQRMMRVYDRAEIDAAKALREQTQHIPGVELANPKVQPATRADLKDLAEVLAAVLQNQNQLLLNGAAEKTKPPIADFKDKFILNFTQARQLSGLSAEELKAGIESGKILSKRRSEKGNYQINRASLEQYCADYFAE